MSSQNKFFGLILPVMMLVIVFGFLGYIIYTESQKSYIVQCAVITPNGAVKTVEFEDERVREENGVIKGKTKVYRLTENESCLIEEIKK